MSVAYVILVTQMRKEVMKTTTKTKAVASIELDGFKLEVSGFYDETDWETTLSFDQTGVQVPSKTWVDDDTYIYNEDDLNEYAWEELFRIIKKYNGFSIEEAKVEVEVEDED
jgi:hypothetical protein